MNYYEVLNIPQNADKPQIKRAYFSMVKTHSPDKDPEGFKRVRLAYETLSDEKKRTEYDAYFDAADDAKNELLAAHELLRQNKYKEAAEFLAKRSRKNPNTETIRLYAETLWRCKKPGKAETLCKTLLQENPVDIDTWLLRAKIAASRGHSTKADDYYNSAINIDPNNPKSWIHYMRHSLEHQRWMVSDIGMRAVLNNPEAFRDDYGLYLHSVCGSTNHAVSLAYGEESVSNATMICFTKFIECLAADKNPDKLIYLNAVSAITYVINEPEYTPHIEKLIPLLEQCKHHDKEDANFIAIRAGLAINKLRADNRIHEVLADLTGYFIEGADDQEERLSMECYIIMELPGIRKAVKALRDGYPEYFKLHQQFYLNVLNERKTEALEEKYYAIYKRLRRMENELHDADYADYEDVVVDPPETLKPYVREAPKVGRNDPCPCDSGKKYKKCCGR